MKALKILTALCIICGFSFTAAYCQAEVLHNSEGWTLDTGTDLYEPMQFLALTHPPLDEWGEYIYGMVSLTFKIDPDDPIVPDRGVVTEEVTIYLGFLHVHIDAKVSSNGIVKLTIVVNKHFLNPLE